MYALRKYAWSQYSQYGEDGVIAHILSKLPTRNSYCVEFGAWDDKHLVVFALFSNLALVKDILLYIFLSAMLFL